ncbi:MAG: flippase-like domain-containing protein [Candidatus Latescibacteria bacterium]|nr:flippase-like domain-containing protein [Candidatus Latescibacterota bacterium]
MRFFSSKLFKIIVSLVLLTYISYKYDIGTILSNMWSADRLLLSGAIGLFLLSGILGAMQWGKLLNFHGIRLGFTGILSRYFMGLFFNYILPGFIGGDVVRVYKTAVASGRGTQSFSSTLADRVIGFLVLVLFSLGAFLFLPSGPANKALPAAIFMFGILAGFFFVCAYKPLGSLINRSLGKIVPKSFSDKLTAVYNEMHELTRSPSTLATVFVLSCCIQISRIGVHYLCGRAVGIDLSFAWFALFVPVIEIVACLPISFGGVGVRETIAFLLFATAGVDKAVVVSYTFLATATGFTGAIPGGIAFAMSVGERNKW